MVPGNQTLFSSDNLGDLRHFIIETNSLSTPSMRWCLGVLKKKRQKAKHCENRENYADLTVEMSSQQGILCIRLASLNGYKEKIK